MVAHAMSLAQRRMRSITSKEGSAMIQEIFSDPDILVFWLTTTLCALFMVVAPGGAAAL